MTIISERLQHLRLTHGYTQTELARTMGVTRRAVYAWEHDKCPEIPHLIQLAQFYQVSTDYLLGLGCLGTRCLPRKKRRTHWLCTRMSRQERCQ